MRRAIANRHSRRGLGLVEATISLAIAAALLTAVAAAFTASGKAIDDNDTFFRATQAARISLNRILTQVRRGAVDTNSTSTSLHLITNTGQDYTYNFDSVSKQLQLVTNGDLTDPDYVLARNVNSMSFSYQTGTNYAQQTCVSRVAILLNVAVGNNTITVSGSAAPRGNFAF